MSEHHDRGDAKRRPRSSSLFHTFAATLFTRSVANSRRFYARLERRRLLANDLVKSVAAKVRNEED